MILFIISVFVFLCFSSFSPLSSFFPSPSTVTAQPFYSFSPLHQRINNDNHNTPYSSSPLFDEFNTINQNNNIDTLSNQDLQSLFHRSRGGDGGEESRDDDGCSLPIPIHPPVVIDSFQTAQSTKSLCKLKNNDNYYYDGSDINNNILSENSFNSVYTNNQWTNSDDVLSTLLASDPSSFSDNHSPAINQPPDRDRRRRRRRERRDGDKNRRRRRLPPSRRQLLIGIPRSSQSMDAARESCQRSCSERVISIEGRGITSIRSDWIEVKMAIEKRIIIKKRGERDETREKIIENKERMKLSLQSAISSRLLSIFRYLLSYSSSIIPRSYLRITSLRIEPEYISGGPGRASEFHGYRSAYALTVRIKINNAMKIITDLLRRGITRIDGISYISNPSTIKIARRSALKKAVNDAFQQIDQFTNQAALHLLISKWDYNQTLMEYDLVGKNYTRDNNNNNDIIDIDDYQNDIDREDKRLLKLFRYNLPYQIVSATINKLSDPPATPLQVSILAAGNDNNNDSIIDSDTDPSTNDNDNDNDNGAVSFESLLLLQELLNNDSNGDDGIAGRRLSLLQGELREIGAAITIRIRF